MSDILDLIDNAIDGWEVSKDAMRWTPEKPDDVDPATGLATGGIIRDGRLYLVGEQAGCDLHGGWFWDTIARHLPQMGRDLARILEEAGERTTP